MKQKHLSSTILYYSLFLIALLGLRFYVFSPVTAVGESMSPTLQNGQKMIGLKNGQIKHFDIVTFSAPDQPETTYVKRVIGLPGDSISYKDDALYINGIKQPEPYLTENKAQLPDDQLLTPDFTLQSLLAIEEIPEGKVFVLGDNRGNSKDSLTFGLIDEASILTRIAFSLWPIEKIGFAE